jgi:hypothetical protein
MDAVGQYLFGGERHVISLQHVRTDIFIYYIKYINVCAGLILTNRHVLKKTRGAYLQGDKNYLRRHELTPDMYCMYGVCRPRIRDAPAGLPATRVPLKSAPPTPVRHAAREVPAARG